MRSLALAGAVSVLSAGALLNLSVLGYFVARALRTYLRRPVLRKPGAGQSLATAHR